jgi:hypothetical protein
MEHPIRAIGGAALFVAVAAAGPAHADICDQYDRTVRVHHGQRSDAHSAGGAFHRMQP